MRKKKHPDQAYKSHEFFDMSLAPGFQARSSGADAVDVRKLSRFLNIKTTTSMSDVLA